jgi:hypothetical protein
MADFALFSWFFRASRAQQEYEEKRRPSISFCFKATSPFVFKALEVQENRFHGVLRARIMS